MYRFIKKHSLQKHRPKNRPRKFKKTPRSPRIYKIIDWGDEGNQKLFQKLYLEDKLSQEKIAETFGVSPGTVSIVAGKLGISRDRGTVLRKYTPEEKVCPICGKTFTSKYESQEFCSKKCASLFSNSKKSKFPGEKIFLKTLEEKNWNYLQIGKFFGVSDNAVKKWAKKYGVHKSKQHSWLDVVDLESAQKKIEELGIRNSNDLYTYYNGLADKLRTRGLLEGIKYPNPKSEFDSSWEERIFRLIEDNITYSDLKHNYVLDPECKYVKALIFDIVIEFPDSSVTVIEIQGPTHFKEVFDAESFNTTRERDEIKYEYCVSHDINILYFTYEPKLLEDYGYPHPVFTSEDLLLEKIKSFSGSSL